MLKPTNKGNVSILDQRNQISILFRLISEDVLQAPEGAQAPAQALAPGAHLLFPVLHLYL